MPFAVAEGEDGWVGSVVWLGFVDVLLPNFEGWDDDHANFVSIYK